MRELHSAGWLAQWPLGYFVLDREAVEFFLRSKKVTFPGLKMAEIFGVTEGPLFEEISRNILSLNGEDHRRLRNLVNPAFAPRAVERYRPAMRGFLEELTPASTTVSARTSRARRCRRRSPTCRAVWGRSNSTASLSSAALTEFTNWSGYRCASASHRLGTSHRSLSENGCRRTRGGWRHWWAHT